MKRAWHPLRDWTTRLGGMLRAPRETLNAILQDRHGTVMDPFILALLTVLACYPATLVRYAWLVRVDAGMAWSKLLGADAFTWGRLRNQGAYALVAAACFLVFGRVVLGRKFRVDLCMAAGAFLYVPMAALALLGALLQHAGVGLPWLPHHPLDGWWVLEGGRVHVDRFYGKLVVEMALPTLMGLRWAWTEWRSARGRN